MMAYATTECYRYTAPLYLTRPITLPPPTVYGKGKVIAPGLATKQAITRNMNSAIILKLIEARWAHAPAVVKHFKPRSISTSALDRFKLYYEEMIPNENYLKYSPIYRRWLSGAGSY